MTSMCMMKYLLTVIPIEIATIVAVIHLSFSLLSGLILAGIEGDPELIHHLAY